MRVAAGILGGTLLLLVVPLAFIGVLGVAEPDLLILAIAAVAGALGCLVTARHALVAAFKGSVNAGRSELVIGAVFAGLGLAVVGKMAGALTGEHNPDYPPEVMAMKSELMDVLGAQEMFYSRNGRFAASVAELPDPLVTPEGVSIVIERGDSAGFRAVARHAELREACFIESGPRALDAPDTLRPQCEGRYRYSPF